MLEVTFYGVRGSTPCSCNDTRRVGGNTSCVLVNGPAGDDPLILDMGTGLRYLGLDLMNGDVRAAHDHSQPASSFRGTALVTHLHWDHIQGIPFFVPLLRDGSKLRFVGPPQPGSSLAEQVASFVRPPAFPVELELLPGTIEFVEAQEETFSHGRSTITVAPVPHVGPTNGYRIDNGSGSVVYIPDHQQPIDGSFEVAESVLGLASGADVLIHDAQYDQAEFDAHPTWGHSTIAYAAEVARRAEVKRLVLFHHDPTHSDAWVDRAVAEAQQILGDRAEVLTAYEGLTLRSGIG